MIFKWQYAHEVAPNPKEDRLLMGTKAIGRVYYIGMNMWRAESFLPESDKYGGCFHADYPSAGIARGTLETVSVMWVSDAALWRDLPATATMAQSTQTD
ncbi:hypothetical protein EX011_21675 [Salmonella enterica]|nr:hypothetical protein [Salmonella enterica]EHQ9605711.1 hypothetical protein [Salmonella enterica]EJF7575712.1 hypothetical protein [Salmonella enterica subsp. enterica]HAV7961513.1 hypothetical protein [Escherichia coli]